MSTKTEERLKIAIKETFIEKQSELENIMINKASIIFFFGVIFGILFAYTNLASLTIGIVIGIAIDRSELPFINSIIIFTISHIQEGQKYMLQLLRDKNKNKNKSLNEIQES